MASEALDDFKRVTLINTNLFFVGHKEEFTAPTYIKHLQTSTYLLNQLQVLAVVDIVRKPLVLYENKIRLIAFGKTNILYK